MKKYVVLWLIMFLPLQAYATDYYVDPQWGGSTKDGHATTPWSTLDSTAKSTINSELATADVTVYFSSRLPGSDADNTYGSPSEIDMTFRTDSTSHLLTFDGISKFNSVASPSTPSWTTNGRTACTPAISACSKVRSFNWGTDSSALHSYITFNGFRVTMTADGKGFNVCGSHITIQNSDVSHTSSGLSGPLIQFIPGADGSHEGTSGSPCPLMTDNRVTGNILHDTPAEILYLGGGACASPDPNAAAGNCQGFPSNQRFEIDHNELYSGTRTSPAEQDCFDVKGGFRDLSIHDNWCHDIAGTGGLRGLVMQGKASGDSAQNIDIYRNRFTNIKTGTEAVIALSDTWGSPNGVHIHDNIIEKTNSGGSGNEGIHVYACTGDCLFANNVIYSTPSLAIDIAGGSSNNTIKNNALLSNNSDGAQVSYSGSPVSDHNVYKGSSFGGTCSTGCVSGLVTTAGTDFVNPATGDFHVASSSSKLSNAGADLTSLGITTLNSDYDGVPRPNGLAWEAGIFELGATPSITSLTPASGLLGATSLSIAVVGSSTNFVNGTTTCDFGSNVTINSCTVTNATHLTANITISGGAATGARNAVFTTTAEVVTSTNGFTVTTVPSVILNPRMLRN